MKTYIKPMMDAELFATNEYIGACYQLECVYAPGNANGQYHTDGTGDQSGCGNPLNQSIQIISGDLDNGATISVVENNVTLSNGEYVGDRDCFFVPREGATNGRESTKDNVERGDVLYWVTDVAWPGYGPIWMPHKGTIGDIVPGRPNHS